MGAASGTDAISRVAVEMGLHHTLPLIHHLGRVSTWSEDLPHQSQRTLADAIGRSERTVRYQIAELERAGLIRVFRQKPTQRRDGTWTRATNRILLCTKRAWAWLTKKYRAAKAQVTPSGNGLPVISPTGRENQPSAALQGAAALGEGPRSVWDRPDWVASEPWSPPTMKEKEQVAARIAAVRDVIRRRGRR